MTRTAVVWCPDWPIVAAGVDGTVVAAAVVRANRVVACSAAARAEGVRRGLRRREAQARCPSLVVLEADPARDARAFEPVVAAIETLTPRVEVVRPGVCAFATLGPSRYFGGDEALMARVHEVVAPVACSVGVADGSFPAAMAARRGVLVPAGASAAFLAPLPVVSVGDDDLADLLSRLGVRTLGELAALPRADVSARFGPAGETAHRLACADEARPLAARVPPPELVVSVELDPPAERVDIAAFAARGLAADLHERLSSRGLACTRISIEAETEHGEHLARVWRGEGALSPAAMAERVRWQLDGWLSGTAAERPTAGITLLRLVPEEIGPDDGRQLGFWGGSAAADDRAGRAFARLQGLFGPDAVTRPVLAGGRNPAEQVRLVPWGDERDAPSRTASPWPGALPSPAPATVFAGDGVAADVVDQRNRTVAVNGRLLATAPPARVAVAGQTREPLDVVAWAGPWPVDERWWDPGSHRRRARFQVVLLDGSAWLLALEGGHWHAEARYD